MSRAPLRVVPTTTELPAPEYLLRQMMPELDAAKRVVAKLEALIGEQGRRLADKRGLTMRPRLEQLRAEFGAKR